MAAVAWVIAHGGLYGALAETAVVAVVAGAVAWIWLRERRRRLTSGRGQARMRE